MHDMSGLEVAARLRTDASRSSTSLIARSAAASEADLQRAKHADFRRVLCEADPSNDLRAIASSLRTRAHRMTRRAARLVRNAQNIDITDAQRTT